MQWILGAWAVWGLWYLSRPGRTVTTLVSDVQSWGTGTVGLSTEQTTNKAIIERAFLAAGMGWAAPAAVANAYAESRLAAGAVGDGGHSIGLFQLHDGASSAGAGMTVEARSDPEVNTARILQVCAGNAAFMASKGKSHADVTRAFAKEIERCALCSTLPEQEARVRNLALLYGAGLSAQVAQ